jgi:type I restriction enzyme R subunit
MTRGTAERDETELPIIEQLKAMGWRHVHGPDLSKVDPDGDERAYSDLLLLKRLRSAVRRVNRLPGGGGSWMSEADADTAIDDLRRTARNVATTSLVAVNGEVTSRLIKGTPVTGDEEHQHAARRHRPDATGTVTGRRGPGQRK